MYGWPIVVSAFRRVFPASQQRPMVGKGKASTFLIFSLAILLSNAISHFSLPLWFFFWPNHHSGRSPAILADGGLRLAMPCWSQVMVSFLLQFPSFVPLFQRDLEGFQT